MSTIPPAPPPMPAPVPAGGGATAAVTVVGTAPPAVQALPPGALLEVVTQARALKGAVEVLTQNGPMTLKLPPDLMALAGGSRLVLQTFQSGGETQFRILSLNGRPILPGGVPLVLTPPNLPAQGAGAGLPMKAAGPPTPGAGAPAPAVTGTPAAPPAQPAGITATVLRPAPAGTAPSPSLAGLPPDLPPGTQVTVRIAGTAPPGAPPPTQAPAPSTAAAAPSAAAPATLQATTPAAPQITGQPAVSPPSGGPPTATPPPAQTPTAAPPPLLTGTVVSQPPGGNAVVQTPAGTLSLPAPAGLPVGSQVALEVVGRPELPPPATTPAASRPQGLTPAGWPAFDEASATLARTDAQAAEQFLRTIPQANPRLAASLAMFASALRSGDIRQILTDAVNRGLDRAGKRDVGDRLKGDIEKLSADSGRPLAGGEWRAYTMPFLNGAAIEAIRLYVRHEPEDQPAAGKGGRGDDQRFVLEVSMTRLGRIQLDGLVQRTDKQFDMIIRTEKPLPQDMRRDILAIFTENADICGTKGMVTFQSGRFVELPPPEAPPAATTLSV